MRVAMAWTLYGIGDLVSKSDRFDTEWFAAAWYPIYNRCMIWSNRIQGPVSRGPWKEPPSCP